MQANAKSEAEAKAKSEAEAKAKAEAEVSACYCRIPCCSVPQARCDWKCFSLVETVSR